METCIWQEADCFVPESIAQGATFYLPIEYVAPFCDGDNYDDDDLYPLDISGYSAVMNIFTTPTDTAGNVVSISTANGGILIDGPNGKLECWIQSTVTAGLAPGVYYYDLYITSPTGLIERLIHGTFTVYQRGDQ